jgi:dolichol-phosphate mannosyltransferase
MKRKVIALIVPVYNEGENLSPLLNKIEEAFKAIEGHEWRLCFVDDGSTDSSWQQIKELTQFDERVSGVTLSRNFGKEMALTAGIENFQGMDAVICMDADLQHPPDKLPEMIRMWENGSEIVVGIRQSVADYSLIKRIGSTCFYRLLKWVSDVDIPPNSTDFRLLDSKVVDTLCKFSERTRMFRGLIDWMGYKKDFLYFDAPARSNSGKPAYSLRKLFRLALNSITSFSLLPLRLTGYLGVLVSFLASVLLLYMIVSDILFAQLYTPQAYLIVFITFLVGIILCALGLMSMYIGHIHTEAVGRPLYIVRKRAGMPDKEQGN